MERLTLYVREGCHLCEDAIGLLEGLARAGEVSFDVVDIGGDAGLEAFYGQRIPVLAAGATILAQAPWDDDEVARRVLRS